MSGPVLPPIPASLKGIQHYLKIATEHDQRDPVVSYWCKYKGYVYLQVICFFSHF